MKALSPFRYALIAIVMLLITTVISSAQVVQTVPFYRLFAHTTGIHFYTADVNRKLEATAAGWTVEGTAAYILTQQAPGTVPLYVLQTRYRYGNYGSSDAVFGYVTNLQERDTILNAPDTPLTLCGVSVGYGSPFGHAWLSDGTGIAGYVATDPLPGTVPLYRLYHPPTFGPEESYRISSIQVAPGVPFKRCGGGSWDNFYTTSVAEKEAAILKAGYKFVSIVGYVWPQPAAVSMQPPVPAKHTAQLIPGNQGAPINPDTYLLNHGCTRSGPGSYSCSTVSAYETCNGYKKGGKVKGCTTTADLAAQAAMDKELFSLGCTRLAGRPDEFICKTPQSFKACGAYHDKRQVKQCVMTKQ